MKHERLIFAATGNIRQCPNDNAARLLSGTTTKRGGIHMKHEQLIFTATGNIRQRPNDNAARLLSGTTTKR